MQPKESVRTLLQVCRIDYKYYFANTLFYFHVYRNYFWHAISRSWHQIRVGRRSLKDALFFKRCRDWLAFDLRADVKEDRHEQHRGGSRPRDHDTEGDEITARESIDRERRRKGGSGREGGIVVIVFRRVTSVHNKPTRRSSFLAVRPSARAIYFQARRMERDFVPDEAAPTISRSPLLPIVARFSEAGRRTLTVRGGGEISVALVRIKRAASWCSSEKKGYLILIPKSGSKLRIVGGARRFSLTRRSKLASLSLCPSLSLSLFLIFSAGPT